MSAPNADVGAITAPDDLGLDSRAAFREAAFQELARLPEGGVLRVDLSVTRRVDSAGLSVLMLIQRRAADRSQRVVLQAPSEEFRYLLALTQLSDLFVLEPRPA